MPNRRHQIRDIIFEAETRRGKLFDLILLAMIVVSVAVVMLESIDSVSQQYQTILTRVELCFTLIFTLEYCLRLWAVDKPFHYMKSFYGLVDFISIIPTYLALLIPGAQSLLVIRILRLLRMFRIMKMVNHIEGGSLIIRALYNSKAKIMVFFTTVFVFSVIAGTMMYIVEGDQNEGYCNIPQSIYWAIVTISTVGYGDIAPITLFGKVIATLTMLSTYAIIAVPTGILSAEMAREADLTSDACPGCGTHGHLVGAKYCRCCGNILY